MRRTGSAEQYGRFVEVLLCIQLLDRLRPDYLELGRHLHPTTAAATAPSNTPGTWPTTATATC